MDAREEASTTIWVTFSAAELHEANGLDDVAALIVHSKLNSLRETMQQQRLGEVLAWAYVIEFQERGPHWLHLQLTHTGAALSNDLLHSLFFEVSIFPVN